MFSKVFQDEMGETGKVRVKVSSVVLVLVERVVGRVLGL